MDCKNDIKTDFPFNAEQLINKEADVWDLKLHIQKILADKPDGYYYIHGKPPKGSGRKHGLYCVPIAKLYKQGDQFDWEWKWTYKTKKFPYKKKGKKWRVPRHRRKRYLIHDERIFPES